MSKINRNYQVVIGKLLVFLMTLILTFIGGEIGVKANVSMSSDSSSSVNSEPSSQMSNSKDSSKDSPEVTKTESNQTERNLITGKEKKTAVSNETKKTVQVGQSTENKSDNIAVTEAQKKGTVVVSYLYNETKNREEVYAKKKITGVVGTPYKTKALDLLNNNGQWILESKSNNTAGLFKSGIINVSYYYRTDVESDVEHKDGSDTCIDWTADKRIGIVQHDYVNGASILFERLNYNKKQYALTIWNTNGNVIKDRTINFGHEYSFVFQKSSSYIITVDSNGDLSVISRFLVGKQIQNAILIVSPNEPLFYRYKNYARPSRIESKSEKAQKSVTNKKKLIRKQQKLPQTGDSSNNYASYLLVILIISIAAVFKRKNMRY
ncbi:hypothetical protein C5L31_000193 [Secundilactobacillus malefermentans]|uniref:Gram-positive cocci surface proteins LPxTG domain-containing protein n=1 Tax=Secundilactobacillus malefermentans TaxID=176292 RepID=A0A4R5NM38_9LACO|nr:LPXTG cell wall anchor domain-containing protein [Secundilactobacillus malefermentans]TDG76640.1 hypothetical protein C5L31_000193 [Secundilactobacillus malefermentans]